MEAPKPTHAYVEYKDGDKAIVSVRLIKYYSPKDVDDLARNKLVYWRKSSKGYMSEDYYRGDIVMLGCGKDELIARMVEQGKAVPKNVFEERSKAFRSRKLTLQDVEGRPRQSGVLKKPAAGRVWGRKRKKGLDSESQAKKPFAPKRSQQAEVTNAELQERLRISEERLNEERQHNIKLQKLLEQRIDTLEASIIAAVKSELRSVQQPSQCCPNHTANGHAPLDDPEDPMPPRDVDIVIPERNSLMETDSQPGEPSPIPGAREEQEDSQGVPSVSRSPENEPEETEPSPAVQAPLFTPVNGKVHIGNGFFIPTKKWATVKQAKSDSLFTRELAKCLWKPHELVNRSVTGIACRSKLKQGVEAKPALSPRKVDAVQMAYYHYVKSHPSSTFTLSRRLKDLNKHLASFLVRAK